MITTLAHPAELVEEIRPGDLDHLRVTFINMPLRESARPNTPPQGPALMAARLRRYGAEVNLIDLNAYRILDDRARQEGKGSIGRHLTLKEAEDLIAAHFLKHGEPHIIGLSGMITTLRWQESLVELLRSMVPDAFVVSGGGLGTELKEGLFRWIPGLDGVVHSEGDDIILVLARLIKEVQEFDTAKRIRKLRETPYFSGDILGRARFLFGGDRPRNLDHLPFAAWDLLEEDVYGNPLLEWYIATPVWGRAANNSSAAPFLMNRSLTTVSSRGCPYNCSFCYRGAQGERLYGMRSAKNLADEARWLVDTYKVDFIGFPDDNFAVDRARIQQLPDAFRELDLRWGTHTRLDEADDRLEGMARSGCIYIGFGAESASAPILNRMDKGGFILKKGVTNIQGYELPVTMVEGIRNCLKWDIHANCTWIMGYPGETLHDLKTSIAFILWQKELYTQGLTSGTPEYETALQSVNRRMFTATAYPGTAMFREPAVIRALEKNFNMRFDRNGNPEFDESFKNYVLELDDATKVLHNKDGEPLNFSAMPTEQFLEARRFIDQGQLEKVMDL